MLHLSPNFLRFFSILLSKCASSFESRSPGGNHIDTQRELGQKTHGSDPTLIFYKL